jgi:hypothetical protein
MLNANKLLVVGAKFLKHLRNALEKLINFLLLFLTKKTRLRQISWERWPSGRRRFPAKEVYDFSYRGFESLPLRH